MDYSTANCLPEIWKIGVKTFSDTLALHDPHSQPEVKLTYGQTWQKIQDFAQGLQALGIQANEKVSIFADNSPRWLIADQGTMTAGCVNVVRSSQADKQELLYILEDSDSTVLVVENVKTLQKLQDSLPEAGIKLIVLLSDETPDLESPIKTLNFTQFMEAGKGQELQFSPHRRSDLATLIYTSGTTGKPKGVMLSHGNLLHQVQNLYGIITPQIGDRIVSILPTWHSYERSAEYFLFAQGCTIVYTNLRYIKKDLKKYQPRYMVAVPRLWESIYEGVQKQFREQPEKKQKLIQFFFRQSEAYIQAQRIAQNLSLDHLHVSSGTRLTARLKSLLLAPFHFLGEKIVYQKVRAATGGQLKAVISGGGSLAKHLELFYEIVNIPILVGYGLTETSPVVSARRLNHNLRGSSGKVIAETDIKIVNPDTGETLPPETKGLVLIKGTPVMQGYYKKPEATAKAIDADGWFDSGDLGFFTPAQDLVLTGRAKDTIVLSNGENIEPQPIEDACVRSAYIDQMMLVGQDQKAIGALIVPNLEALQQWATQNQRSLTIPETSASFAEIQASDLYKKEVLTLLRHELNREVKNRSGYRPDDQIKVFEFLLEPFTIENGMMTQTMKVKRPVVRERYQDIINAMYR